ncbi:hypothetical protein ACFY8B_26525 [Streptomyces sp. NPDC012751]|uniref:mycothiol-dependent nitroreductase Rv2466c family protein n=1 Tax=Streptomyces sp. NPDC012751 TaxID=3364846 RepID=UPI0036847C2C
MAPRGSHVITEALEEAGLPASLASSATSIQVEQLIKDSHHEAFDEVGLDVGGKATHDHEGPAHERSTDNVADAAALQDGDAGRGGAEARQRQFHACEESISTGRAEANALAVLMDAIRRRLPGVDVAVPCSGTPRPSPTPAACDPPAHPPTHPPGPQRAPGGAPRADRRLSSPIDLSHAMLVAAPMNAGDSELKINGTVGGGGAKTEYISHKYVRESSRHSDISHVRPNGENWSTVSRPSPGSRAVCAGAPTR